MGWLTDFICYRLLVFVSPMQVIKAARKEMLQGCKVVLSRVFPNTSRPQEQMMWKMAETRGRGSGNREGPLGCEQQEVFGPPALDQSRQFPMAPATGGRFSRNSPEGKEQR